jgi:hypothetical protein
MPVEIVDIDAVLPEDRELKIAGHGYRIPGSPPMEWYLWLRQFLRRINTAGYELVDDDIAEGYDHVLELLRIRKPALTTVPELSPAHIFAVLSGAYASIEEEDAGPPQKRTRGATASRQTRSRRRSST